MDDCWIIDWMLSSRWLMYTWVNVGEVMFMLVSLFG